MDAVCSKCRKRKSCKVPCYPVEQYLKQENRTLYEKRNSDTITLYPFSHQEMRRSALSMGEDKSGDPRLSSKEAQAFSTEAENPFRHYEPNHKQVSVFIKRFFSKWSYKDIAKAHDISVDAARKLYYAGVQRLLTVIMEMDVVEKMTEKERKRANVAKQKRYYEHNQEKVKAARRERYARNKERINAKRREAYAANKKQPKK